VLHGYAPRGLAREFCAGQDVGDSVSALARHLGDFKRLMLGAAVLARRDCLFETPLHARLPMAIPGTALTLEGDGRVSIAGFERGVLHVEREGERLPVSIERTADGPVQVVTAPMITFAGCRIRMQPQAYHVPGLSFGRIVVAAGMRYQQEHRPAVEAALGLVKEYQPEVFQQLRQLIRLIALKPRTPQFPRRDNVSHSDFPGAVVMNPTAHGPYLADVLIHELHHNRLFFIEEIEPLFRGAEAPPDDSASGYYSPWQNDGRPLHAIFHALYVFLAVSRFWLSLHSRGQADATTAAMVADRLLRGRLQIRIAAHQLRRHAQLTDFGRQLFEGLSRDVAQMDEAIDAVGLPNDVPAIECGEDGTVMQRARAGAAGFVTARESVVEHLQASALEDQARDILAHVAL
jgi:HEXXH motif-containing protein